MFVKICPKCCYKQVIKSFTTFCFSLRRVPAQAGQPPNGVKLSVSLLCTMIYKAYKRFSEMEQNKMLDWKSNSATRYC